MNDPAPDGEPIAVLPIASVDTHDLRRRVLRDGSPAAGVEWDGDDAPDTVHLGVVVDGGVVAVSTWLATRAPDGRRAVQLRGMASSQAGRGHGSALLQAGLDHARARSAEVVWANARIGAIEFYERAGFEAVGPVFDTAETGLPHRLLTFDLGASGSR